MKRISAVVLLLCAVSPTRSAAQVLTTIEGPATNGAALEVTSPGDAISVRAVEGTGVVSSGYYMGLDAAGEQLGARIANALGNAQLQLVPSAGVGPVGPSWGPTEAGTFHVDANGTLWFCTAGGENPTWVALTQQGPPAGAVMFFNLAACPSGWTELVAAQGRTIVARPAAGTTGGTVGAPLTNLENRAHAHPVGAVRVVSSGFASGYTYVAPSGSTGAAADVTPYIQLLACQKN